MPRWAGVEPFAVLFWKDRALEHHADLACPTAEEGFSNTLEAALIRSALHAHVGAPARSESL